MAEIHDAVWLSWSRNWAATMSGSCSGTWCRRRCRSEAIGARPHERTEGRTNHRNGGRPRVLSTPAGDVELGIPKVREGTFFPSLLEPRRWVDRALWAVIMTAYVTGTSTRKVDECVKC